MSREIDRVSGVPIGVPTAWSRQIPLDVQGAQTGATTATHFRGASSRVGRRALSAVKQSMSERDWEVLRQVDAHRYLTSRQVEALCFAGHASELTAARVCRRVLRRLHLLHVIEHLERRVGGVRAGSASYVWRVGNAGDQILREITNSTRRRGREPGTLFLDHCLAVADAHIDIIREARGAAIELIAVQTEPNCWRPYTGLGGARLVLQPDLYLVTGAGEYEDHWFLEVDRGTENPARLIAKCGRYQDYRQTGVEQSEGGSFPLVVWVMRSEEDADRLMTSITQESKLDPRLFRVTTSDKLASLIRGGAA